MDEAIRQYIKRNYNLLIGDRTAETLKIEIGSAWELDEPLSMEIRGRNLTEGIPKTITVTDKEVREALADCGQPLSTPCALRWREPRRSFPQTSSNEAS
jgi:rod shape-determining protein MreB